MPKGKKWTSAFKSCCGGYLKSNHIGLTGLFRFEKSPQPNAPMSLVSSSDFATVINIRFRRGKDTIDNILASDRHGMLQQSVYIMLHAGCDVTTHHPLFPRKLIPELQMLQH